MAAEKITSSRELAKLAGVSHITVSRAFRGDPRVRPETRKRIFELAEQHGYRPNPVISLAMKAKSKRRTSDIVGSLAFVHSNFSEHSWVNTPHLRPYTAGMEACAAESGFSIDYFWISPRGGMTAKRVAEVLKARGIQGVIIAPPVGKVRRVHFDWDEFSCVTFEHESWRPLLHRVAFDELHRVSLALRHAERLGYKRPGLAVTTQQDIRANHALTGRLLASQIGQKKADIVPPLTYQGPEIDTNSEPIKKWIQKYQPDCVICQDVSALKLFQSFGYSIPRELGIIHLSIGPDVADWSGCVPDHHVLGATVVDMVINRMARNETGIPDAPREVLLRCRWQNGKTTLRQ